MRLTNPATNLSCEPDGLLVMWQSVREGRVRFVESADEGCVEIEGSPDIVLEVVSTSSERKDNTTLRELYWQAGIPEYWLIDARREPLQFVILRHDADGYQMTASTTDGWIPSLVLDREFRLTQEPDPLGHPQYTLEVRSRVA
jgi:Uma2 family endonuclease